MDAKREREPTAMKNPVDVERTSDREVTVRRTIDGPVHLVFEAWTNADLFRRWWVPKSFGVTLLACELDARTGGTYRLVFGHGGSTMDFFGRYLEVTPHARIVWTNEEGGDGGAVTTATFEEKDGKTFVVVRDLYPSKEALDAGAGAMAAMGETLQQLDELVAGLASSVSRGASPPDR